MFILHCASLQIGVVKKANKLHPALKTIVITPVEVKDYEQTVERCVKDTILFDFCSPIKY